MILRPRWMERHLANREGTWYSLAFDVGFLLGIVWGLPVGIYVVVCLI